MRRVVLISLVLALQACVSAKDYSGATKLEDVKSQVAVKLLWIKASGDVPENAHAQLMPAINDQNAFVADVHGRISKFNLGKGKLQWIKSLGERITGGPGIGSNMIFIGTRNAEIIALSQKDGAEHWRSKISSEMLSTPVFSDGSLYVQTIDGKISAIDGNTGKLNWVYSHDTPKLTLRGTASPVVVGNQVISGFADGKLVSIDARTGELGWSASIGSPKGRTDLERLADIDGAIQVMDGTAYVVSYQGRIAAVSIADGNIQWSRKMSSYAGLSLGGTQLFVSDMESHLWSLDARTGATLWKQEGLTGREITTPQVIGKTVVVADFDGFVHWLSVEDGQFVARKSMDEMWEEENPTYYDSLYDELDAQRYHRSVSVKPVVVGDMLIVRDNFGALAAFYVEQ